MATAMLLVLSLFSPGLGQAGSLSVADRDYLKGICRDTWHCISEMAAPKTGFPFDNADHSEFTSVSNIGIYLSTVCVAGKMGLINREEQDSRLDQCLTSIEKLRTQFGFQQSWNSVVDLQPAKHDPWISLLDSGNLAAGLLTVAQASPKQGGRAVALFKAMDWGKFYDRSQVALIGGYSLEKHEFNTKWHLDLLASDALMCQFLAVSTGAAPSSFWSTLHRDKETKEGMTYLGPGWVGGGLFMQFISGLWLDTTGTPIAASAQDFAQAQIRHAKTISAPVWGWSACDNPDGGYLGWGSLKDEVVTPHASALAIEMFPKESIANLRALESLGVRSPDRGFYDSLNWKTGAKSKQFLVLDQGMLFLSLANYLEEDVVRKWFQVNPVVTKGRKEFLRAMAL